MQRRPSHGQGHQPAPHNAGTRHYRRSRSSHRQHAGHKVQSLMVVRWQARTAGRAQRGARRNQREYPPGTSGYTAHSSHRFAPWRTIRLKFHMSFRSLTIAGANCAIRHVTISFSINNWGDIRPQDTSRTAYQGTLAPAPFCCRPPSTRISRTGNSLCSGRCLNMHMRMCRSRSKSRGEYYAELY